jgi:hypothetical protein
MYGLACLNTTEILFELFLTMLSHALEIASVHASNARYLDIAQNSEVLHPGHAAHQCLTWWEVYCKNNNILSVSK